MRLRVRERRLAEASEDAHIQDSKRKGQWLYYLDYYYYWSFDCNLGMSIGIFCNWLWMT